MAFATGAFVDWATNVSRQIAGPFVGGDTLSVADLKVYVAMRSYRIGVYDHIPSDILDPFPKITELMAAVVAHPKMSRYTIRAQMND